MAAIKRTDNLAKDAPYKLLLANLVLVLEVSDDAPQIAIATVFHVQMQVLGGLDVVPLKVCDDVGMPEFLENGELGLELFALLLRHFQVADFLAAQDLCGD
jgi:hypothetical protein